MRTTGGIFFRLSRAELGRAVGRVQVGPCTTVQQLVGHGSLQLHYTKRGMRASECHPSVSAAAQAL